VMVSRRRPATPRTRPHLVRIVDIADADGQPPGLEPRGNLGADGRILEHAHDHAILPQGSVRAANIRSCRCSDAKETIQPTTVRFYDVRLRGCVAP